MPDRTQLRVQRLEQRLPMAFRWRSGQTIPIIGTEEVAFFEDIPNDDAKIIMRKGSRQYIFFSGRYDPGDTGSGTYTPTAHAHRHATSSDGNILGTGSDPITPHGFVWTGVHLFAPTTFNVVPVTVRAASLNPVDISGLEAWWKADSIVGIANGGSVHFWEDSSGHGHDLTKYDATGPTYQTSAVNSLPSVYFPEAGAHRDMSMAIPLTLGASAAGYTIFMVYAPKAGVADPAYFFGNSTTGERMLAFADTGGSTSQAIVVYLSGGSVIAGSAAFDIVNDSYNTFTLWRTITTGAHHARMNGTDYSTLSTNTTSITVNEISEHGLASHNRIAEMLVYSRELTSVERGQVEDYLNAKYNLNAGADPSTADIVDFQNAQAETISAIIGTGAFEGPYVRLLEQTANPGTEAQAGSVFTKDDGSGNTELYYLDESGNAVQLTLGSAGVGHVIQFNDVSVAQRNFLDFSGGVRAVDNSPDTDVSLDPDSTFTMATPNVGRWNFGPAAGFDVDPRISLWAVDGEIVQAANSLSGAGPMSFVSATYHTVLQAMAFKFLYTGSGSGANRPTDVLRIGEAIDEGSRTTITTTAFKIDGAGTPTMSRKNTTAWQFSNTAEEIAGLGPSGSYNAGTFIQTWAGIANVFDVGIAVGDTDRSIYFDNDFVSHRLQYDLANTRYEFDDDVSTSVGGIIVNRTFAVNSELALHNVAGSPANRKGGRIAWYRGNTAGTEVAAGYTFVNNDNRLVFQATTQAAGTDVGVAWVDFDDGSASFGSGTSTLTMVGSGGFIYGNSLLNDKITDAAGAIAHKMRTTNSLTPGGATEGDLRRIASWSNVTTEKGYIDAAGNMRVVGGYWAAEAVPVDGQTPYYKNYLSYVDTATSVGFAGLFVEVKRIAAAGSASDRGILLSTQDISTGNQTGLLYGAEFANSMFGTAARTVSGPFYGGVFTNGWSNTGIYAAANATGGLFSGVFQYRDYGAATSAHTSTTSGFLRLQYDSVTGTNNFLCATTNFWGIEVPDISSVNATNSQVMSIASQAANSAAGKNNIHFIGGAWNTGHIQLGDSHQWQSSGRWRVNNGAPTSDADYDLEVGGGALIYGPETSSSGFATQNAETVVTTNATQTTVDTFTLADNTVYNIEARVTAIEQSTPSTGRASYSLSACVYRTNGGVATIQAQAPIYAHESAAAWDVVFDTDGANALRVRVTGAAATNIRWACVITRISVIQ